MDREFEEMMNELSKRLAEDSERDFESELIEDVKPMCSVVDVIHEELMGRGFTDEQAFEFATEFTIRLFEASL